MLLPEPGAGAACLSADKAAAALDAAVAAHIARLLRQAGGARSGDLRQVEDWILDCARTEPVHLRLSLLVCQAAGGVASDAVAVAAAWHLLYCAAHLLDDVADAECFWLPPSQAINASVTLIFLAQLSLTTLKDSQVDPDRIVALVSAFNTKTTRMALGQASDLAWDAQSATLNDYWSIAQAKTGEFYALACQAGALVGTDEQAEIDRYTTFGYHLGVLVQVADDLQALWRPRGRGDLLTAGRTLPVVYGLSVASPEGKEHLHHLLASAPDSAEAQHELLVELARLGALHYIALQGGLQHQLAREAILSAPRPTAAHERLLEMLDSAFPAIGVADQQCAPSRVLNG